MTGSVKGRKGVRPFTAGDYGAALQASPARLPAGQDLTKTH